MYTSNTEIRSTEVNALFTYLIWYFSNNAIFCPDILYEKSLESSLSGYDTWYSCGISMVVVGHKIPIWPTKALICSCPIGVMKNMKSISSNSTSFFKLLTISWRSAVAGIRTEDCQPFHSQGGVWSRSRMTAGLVFPKLCITACANSSVCCTCTTHGKAGSK